MSIKNLRLNKKDEVSCMIVKCIVRIYHKSTSFMLVVNLRNFLPLSGFGTDYMRKFTQEELGLDMSVRLANCRQK